MVQNFEEMGQNASLPRGRRKSLRSFIKRNNSKRILSHTFTVPDTDDYVELLNINSATEEDLMTLPGINREIAKNIVDYRKAIGRFRRIEDLALVTGVGAQKLELLRPEICVVTRRNVSHNSSRAPSYDSLKSTDSRITNRSTRMINLNKASVFELQSIPGVNQEIAAAILLYRNRKGPFNQIEELLKVKHVNRILLSNISRYLTLDDDNDALETSTRSRIIMNGSAVSQISNGHIYRPLLKSQVPNGLASSSLSDIFELLSAYLPRPISKNTFKCSRDGEAAIRIGSWNLHELSHEKANNLGVQEVICRTILENCLSLLVIQGIRDIIALKIICDELNKPTLKRVEEWTENNHDWNFCMLDTSDSQLGFLYNVSGVGNIELLSLMEGPPDTRQYCDSLIGNFLIGNLNLQIVNIFLKTKIDLDFLRQKICDLTNEEEYVMICIDFSDCMNFDEKILTLGNLNAVFPTTMRTHFPNFKLDNQLIHVSNTLTNPLLNKNLTGYKNVVTKGITHLAIPNGWSWGGPASPFYPTWIEIFVNHKSNGISM